MGDLGFVAGPLILGYLSSTDSQAIISSAPFYFNAAVLIVIAALLFFAKDTIKKTT
jgi:hypothetical protein